MNIKEIKSLAQIMEASGLTSLSITEGEVQINMERKTESTPSYFMPPSPNQAGYLNEILPSRETPPYTDPVLTGINPAPVEPVVDFNHITEIKSPMVGIFYAAPSPDVDPYVQVGSKVKKGDVLCIIEAMKLMNEIIAEEEGEIVDICVSTGQVVEYSQPLFKLF